MRGVNINQNTTFVVDTSFVLAFLLPDEKVRNVDEMFSEFEKNKIIFIAPYLLVYEIVNGLKSAVVQERQSKKAGEVLLESFLNMGILFENINEIAVFHLALKENISAYDASFVWLAKEKKVRLLTLDERLEKL